MDNEFYDFVAKRCDGELMQNKDYNVIQKQAIEALRKNDIEKYSECNILLQDITQRVCYIKGLKDMELFLK